MKKALLYLLFFATLVWVQPTQAVTKSFLVTEGFHVPEPQNTNGFPYFTKSIAFVYKKGPVFLSKNPDGTGSVTIGDMLRLQFSFPQTGLITYTGHSNLCTQFNDIIPPQDITHMFKPHLNEGIHNITVRLQHWCLRPKTIGSIYVVYKEEDPPTPTPTMAQSPTPIPFLDLPWDYETNGLNFSNAAINMSSYFDHTYPLLSSSLTEPSNYESQITTYENEDSTQKSYSKHDGYDYARTAKAFYGDSVLAAASGLATFHNTCTPCGNAIYIDHGNYYQTRYYHLQKEGLVIAQTGEKIQVQQGQSIGTIGATGNVRPAGEDGAHIHFMVIEDKNKDGNFQDNIPDGLTDPYGWQNIEPDPWEQYSFIQNEIQRTGNKSHYLWTKKLDEKVETGSDTMSLTVSTFTVAVPADISADLLTWKVQIAPHAESSKILRSLGPTVEVTAKNFLGELVTSFNKLFTVEVDFSREDILLYNPATMSIYSSSDGTHWQPEVTTIDWETKKAYAQVNHLTRFALMAERTDIIAPATIARLSGAEGNSGWYRSDVTIELVADDNEGGLGVDYTLFVEGIDGWDWDDYTSPLSFSSEGHHILKYYSADIDENIEKPHSLSFYIDKTPPEAQIAFDLTTDSIAITSTDTITIESGDQKKDNQFIARDQAGNILSLFTKFTAHSTEHVLQLESLQYNNAAIVDLSNHRLKVNQKRDNKNHRIYELTQVWTDKEELKLKLQYDELSDQTKILTTESGKEKIKMTVPGMKILQLQTQQGTINYKY